MQGICKLCGNQADLQDSHIIPRGMQKRLKTDGKNLKGTMPFDNVQWNIHDVKEYLLCEACEKVLCKFERPSQNHLLNASDRKMPIPRHGTESVERLIRSVFWRASVGNAVPNYKLPMPVEQALGNYLLGTQLGPTDFLTEVSIIPAIHSVQSGGDTLIIEPFRGAELGLQESYFSWGGLLLTMVENNVDGQRHLRPNRTYRVSKCRLIHSQIIQVFLDQLKHARYPGQATSST